MCKMTRLAIWGAYLCLLGLEMQGTLWGSMALDPNLSGLGGAGWGDAQRRLWTRKVVRI